MIGLPKIHARHAMAFVAMNAGLAVHEFQKYYTCEEQNITAMDHMKMAVGLMDQRGLVCPTQHDTQMMIIDNLLKTGAIIAVDFLTAGVKSLAKWITKKVEKEDIFYDALETDENRLPYIYECIDNKRMPNYSVNHLFCILREERLEFANIRYILAELYAICMKHGEKQWGRDLKARSVRFFRGYSFHEYFPAEGF